MKHAQGTWVSPAGIPTRLACEVGALGVQPRRSNGSLAGARTVDCSPARGSMRSGDAPSSATSERFVGDLAHRDEAGKGRDRRRAPWLASKWRL